MLNGKGDIAKTNNIDVRQLSKRLFLKECVRMELERVTMEMEAEGKKFELESARISKESE